MSLRKLRGVIACSDDDDEPGDGIMFKADSATIMRAARLAIDICSSMPKESTAVGQANIEIDEDCLDVDLEFEDEEFRLGSPTKKRKGRGLKLTTAESKQALKERATIGWLKIILLDVDASLAGRRLKDKDSEEQMKIMRVYAAKKSGNTLINRLGPVSKYARWAVAPGIQSGWPPSEEAVIDYIDKTFNGETAKSCISRLQQSLNMMAHAFQFGRSVKSIGESVYIEGLAVQMLQDMPPVKSAKALRLDMVTIIEAAVYYRKLGRVLHMMAGNMLILVYFRARLGDTDRVITIAVYEDRVEMLVEDTKTSKLRVQPALMAPGATLSGLVWLPDFISWRRKQGAPIGDSWPLFPSLKEGQWVQKPARNGDINELMTAVVSSLGISAKVTSHRCKGALLDAAVVYGIKKPVRLILGYHVDNADKAVNAYAPSIQHEPVSQLNRMVIAYAEGKWDPDRIREPKKDLKESSSSSDGSSSDGKSSKASSDIEAIAQEEIVMSCLAEDEVDTRWCKNFTNDKVHRGRRGEQMTACNNPIGERIRLVDKDDIDEATADLCLICFGRTLTRRREMLRRMSEPLLENLTKDLPK